MKRKVILISFITIFILIVAFCIVNFRGTSRDINQAVNRPGSVPVNIIYEQKVSKGSIVFCITKDGKGLITSVVKKNIFGYKVVYWNAQGDIKRTTDKVGLTDSYFPSINKLISPMYFGIIGNPEIKKVKIIEKQRNIEAEAKIIDANSYRIWLINMDKFQGSRFDIIGLTADDKEITNRHENIYPWTVEQKPLKL
ncbi:hypothetical protein [Clostridium folliculivorans]|uniref:hypothetical protein n=1 Tax=Clostridium folliculivorans TaxID=2886038 RepID=UPI0021C3F11D|nr:hypothetical protein [Clostridium folliculivorans]GKU32355.1 hypothetical protein CFB3_44630 [Clostridium folliculivorans]